MPIIVNKTEKYTLLFDKLKKIHNILESFDDFFAWKWTVNKTKWEGGPLNHLENSIFFFPSFNTKMNKFLPFRNIFP